MKLPVIINESGMCFGPYTHDKVFRIEESSIYKSLEGGVKIAEFLLLRSIEGKKPLLCVVEAKQSSPKPENSNFNGFIEDISEKMVNSFSLGWALRLKRHPNADSELPKQFQKLDLSEVDVRFVLVIKGHKNEWLGPLQEAIERTLRSTTKTWGLGSNPVAVMNERLAKKHQLLAGIDIEYKFKFDGLDRLWGEVLEDYIIDEPSLGDYRTTTLSSDEYACLMQNFLGKMKELVNCLPTMQKEALSELMIATENLPPFNILHSRLSNSSENHEEGITSPFKHILEREDLLLNQASEGKLSGTSKTLLSNQREIFQGIQKCMFQIIEASQKTPPNRRPSQVSHNEKR